MELVRLAIGAASRALSYCFFLFISPFFFLEAQSNPFITRAYFMGFLERRGGKKASAEGCWWLYHWQSSHCLRALSCFLRNKEHQQPVAQERQSQISLLGTSRPHEVRAIRQSNEITAPERVYYIYYHIDFAGLPAHSTYKRQT